VPISATRAAIRQPCSGSVRIFYAVMELTCLGAIKFFSARTDEIDDFDTDRPHAVDRRTAAAAAGWLRGRISAFMQSPGWHRGRSTEQSDRQPDAW
jgi:hypothetical protein